KRREKWKKRSTTFFFFFSNVSPSSSSSSRSILSNLEQFTNKYKLRNYIAGVEVNPKVTRETIKDDEFVLAEYHSDFPQLLNDALSQLTKEQKQNEVKMKAYDNQWMLASISQKEIYYWNTAFSHGSVTHVVIILRQMSNEEGECYYVNLGLLMNEDDIELPRVEDIHLLYPFAPCHSSLHLHHASTQRPTDPLDASDTSSMYVNPFLPCLDSGSSQLSADEHLAHGTNPFSGISIFPSEQLGSFKHIVGIAFVDNTYGYFYFLHHCKKPLWDNSHSFFSSSSSSFSSSMLSGPLDPDHHDQPQLFEFTRRDVTKISLPLRRRDIRGHQRRLSTPQDQDVDSDTNADDSQTGDETVVTTLVLPQSESVN
ncbi:hypothetical protein RFI_21211, partial [Reticulomyxa filosa]